MSVVTGKKVIPSVAVGIAAACLVALGVQVGSMRPIQAEEPARTAEPQDLRVRRLVVVDSSGQPTLILGTMKRGEFDFSPADEKEGKDVWCGMFLLGADKKVVGWMARDGKGTSQVAVQTPDGNARNVSWVTKDGGARTELKAKTKEGWDFVRLIADSVTNGIKLDDGDGKKPDLMILEDAIVLFGEKGTQWSINAEFLADITRDRRGIKIELEDRQ